MDSELSRRWDKSHERIPKDKRPSKYAEEVQSVIPDHAHVVDVGGGAGADTWLFLQHGHPVTLVDISAKALETAKERAAQSGLEVSLATFQADFNQDLLPLADDSADVIYSRLALHYFLPDRTAAIYRDLLRVLKDGGQAFITVKSPDDADEMAYLRTTTQEVQPNVFSENGDIKSRYTVDQLKEILDKAGIQNYQIGQYKEDLSGNNDVTKSGNLQQLLTQITFVKGARL